MHRKRDGQIERWLLDSPRRVKVVRVESPAIRPRVVPCATEPFYCIRERVMWPPWPSALSRGPDNHIAVGKVRPPCKWLANHVITARSLRETHYHGWYIWWCCYYYNYRFLTDPAIANVLAFSQYKQELWRVYTQRWVYLYYENFIGLITDIYQTVIQL